MKKEEIKIKKKNVYFIYLNKGFKIKILYLLFILFILKI
jgi:hypothetical protein